MRQTRTELTSCFEVAAAGRYPYTGRLGILSEQDKQQVRDALHLVQADELADRDFTKISDGQRQRVLLARAVCQQPEIILLDEPTSFLDIKGKIELLTILRQLAQEKQVAVIVSLHELELAQKIADTVVCVSPQGVSGVMTPKDAFAAENIRTLYRLTKEQYEALYGPQPEREPERRPAKQEPPRFEHYIRSGQKLLRCGYTTGTCAALGAAGAARLLLTGKAPESVGLRTPKGIVVEVAPIYCRKTAAGAQCAIRKDGGDDVDVTTGLPVIADITLLPDAPGQVTIDGRSYAVPQPFMVIATQNPIEQLGTYKLPEAQMDRFLIKTTIGYPSHDVSVNILKQVNVTDRAATVHPVLTSEDVLRMRNISETVHLDDAILEYIVRLVEATRHNERIQVGSSMRGALALTRCARVWAASDNRGYVVPDDVKNLAVPVLAHRITLTAEATFAGNTPEQMIGQILEDVPAPTLGANA